jgi:hypothetical protein
MKTKTTGQRPAIFYAQKGQLPTIVIKLYDYNTLHSDYTNST